MIEWITFRTNFRVASSNVSL